MSEIASRLKGFVIAVLIAAAAMYLLIAVGSRAPRPSTTGVGVTSVPAGSDGRLSNGMSVVPLALEEELVPDLVRSAVPRAANTLATISDRLFFVASETPVRVSESSIHALRVRILAGSSKGRLGWVPSEWVKPSN